MEIVKYTKIIVQRTPSAIMVKCGHCSGTGSGCSVCGGAGKVLLNIPTNMQSPDVVKCAHCSGDGGYSSPCKACKGVGAVIGDFPRVECASCLGDGGYSSPCRSCNGIGSIAVNDLKRY